MEEIKKQYPLLAVLQLNSSGQGPVIGYANYKDTADINRYLSMPETVSYTHLLHHLLRDFLTVKCF